ncbi:cytochrome P450 [Actinomadura rupiterrae]|uniref:cytochrome P450 n=1 Tax=Actinomadura rupiterrae TaxID=559627 RepID=UPI0020A61057|nr:cytochrome P450 [Actinomadura rupiterrae]MCP2336547.1 cytochrome P450 [Actinomadura rupiterrae]
MSEPELLFNPFEPGFTDDPYPAYRRLREADPVHESPIGIWLLTSHQDVTDLLRSDQSVDERQVSEGLFVAQMREFESALSGRGRSMLDLDPPDHTRLRGLVSKVFTPRRIAALEPEITALVDAALDEIEDAGTADLVETLAFPLPFTVISSMLGMPPTDAARVRELSGWVVRSLEPLPDDEAVKRVGAAGVELYELVRGLIADKRANPGDDLLSALIAAEAEGDRLTDDELVDQVVLLYVAGHETTVNLIGGGTVALLRNPAQLALLRENPDLAANAVEELLRFVSPVQQSRRVTVTPYKVRDKEIPAQRFVVAGLAAANRDPEFFGPDAEELRLDRPNARQHVAFGGGPHHCLGAALARLEGRVAFERLVARFPHLALDGDVTWNGRINLRGPSAVPVGV